MRIAFTGNPNSGKTTMYNAITGKKEHAGNWAGVTVAKKESPMKKDFCGEKELIAVDLPGAYSMSPFTSEESITSSYVKKEKPDAIVNIVDATNLSRSLFFTTQLLELGIPMVVALNKSDMVEKKGITIDVDKLSAALHCPVVLTSATQKSGLEDLIAKVNSMADTNQEAPYVQEEVDLTSKEAVSEADRKRFDFVNKMISEVESRNSASHEETGNDKLDGILAHKIIGIPIFMAVMWLVFSISQAWVGPVLGEALAGALEGFGEGVAESLSTASPFLQSLVVDGIIGGVAAVLGFLPLVMVMYFLIALLEDCGYMARVAVVMDPILKKVGLTGKSVIPMVIGTGCAIPAVMASRTIRNERERRTTAMLTPFMPCGAKIPVIALFAGAFFEDAAWVSTLMYFSGILIIVLGAYLIQIITGHKNRKSFFIIELPDYKAPSIPRALLSMCDRAKDFIIKAGTIILVCNAAVHIMQTFDTSLNLVEESGAASILENVATPFAILFVPLGFGTWRLAAAAITGFIAKENVVGTLAVVFALTEAIDEEELEMIGEASEIAMAMDLTPAAALAYLMFNLFTPPCFAAIGAMNSEMRSAKWLWGGIGLQFGVGYTVAFLVYQIGSLASGTGLGDGFAMGAIVVAVMVGYVVYLAKTAPTRLSNAYKMESKVSSGV